MTQVLSIILVALLALAVVSSLILFNIVFERRAIKLRMPGRRADGTPPWLPYEAQINAGEQWFEQREKLDAWMTARDGAKLHGFYLPCEGSDRTIILCHGYRTRSAQFDFSCALKLYADMGYNLLLIEERAHGRSGGNLTTFGVLEKGDIADWAASIDRETHPKTLVLDGMSMGAASVLMALGEALPASVKGAIADCGYTRANAILYDVLGRAFHLPAKCIMPALRALFWLRTGRNLSEADAPAALRGSKLPVLLIHGEADTFVPCRMARENYAACADRGRLVLVPGAEHGLSYLVDQPRVAREVTRFLQSLDA